MKHYTASVLTPEECLSYLSTSHTEPLTNTLNTAVQPVFRSPYSPKPSPYLPVWLQRCHGASCQKLKLKTLPLSHWASHFVIEINQVGQAWFVLVNLYWFLPVTCLSFMCLEMAFRRTLSIAFPGGMWGWLACCSLDASSCLFWK